MNNGRWQGFAAVLVATVLWGTTGTASALAPSVGPVAIGAAALGIGGLLQAAVAVRSLRAERFQLGGQRWTVLLGGSAVAVYPLAFYSSMREAGIAIGSVVSLGSAPLVSGLLERSIERRPLSRAWLLAAALGIIGSVLMAMGRTGHGDAATSSATGICLGLVAGASYAVYSWCAHRLMRREVTRAAAMGSVFGVGGALLLPVLLMTGAPLIASGRNLAVASYMVLVPMFLGYLLFGYALTRLHASTATTITLAEPVIATVLAVFIVGEQLSSSAWVGMAAIGGTLVILGVASRAGVPTAAHDGIDEGAVRASVIG